MYSDFRAGNVGAVTRRQQQLVGASMVVVSAAAIGIVPTLARLAYDGGSITITVITARSIFSAAVSFLVVILLDPKPGISPRSLVISLGLGVLYAILLYALLAAVTYLPVNMVMLIFFLHPLMIGLASVLAGHEAWSLTRLAALVGAAVGLSLAVGFCLDNLDLTGMALAFVAAAIAAVVITGGAIAMRDSDSLVVTNYMMLGSALVLGPFSLLHGGMELPITSGGWMDLPASRWLILSAPWHSSALFRFSAQFVPQKIGNLKSAHGILFAMLNLGERVCLSLGAGWSRSSTRYFLGGWARAK